MSSSTSSSDQAPGTRKIYLRILLAIVLGMATALASVQAFVAANGAGSRSILGRVIEAQEAIPSIAGEKEDLVLVFGSSMVEAGFSPREFDRDLAEQGIDIKSFNFGFGGLNPLFQDYLSRRMVEQFQAQDRRIKLLLIEFNPFQTTVTRREGARALEESYIALLASPKELFDVFMKDPERGLRMLQIRYLRDGISAEMITTFFWGEPFEQQAPRTQLVQEEGIAEALDELQAELGKRFSDEYPDYDGSDWYYPWQGGGTIQSERPAETVALFNDYYRLTQTDFRKDNARLRRIATSDIVDLNFDPELVDAFIRIVNNFKVIADDIEIVLLPKNHRWIDNPPEALARQADVVEQIKKATGVPVRDFQKVESLGDEMFSDTTHLNRYRGAVIFTRLLAEQYQRTLRP
ncbi:MAG: hypothetical protein AAF465_14405 [Pseudomonadota bacterium]